MFKHLMIVLVLVLTPVSVSACHDADIEHSDVTAPGEEA